MNSNQFTAETSDSSRRHRTRLGLSLGLLLLAVGLAGCFNVSSDTEALRTSLLNSTAGEWEKEVEIGVGALTFGLARTGLEFLVLDPQARSALNTVRGADVGVYWLRQRCKAQDLARMLSSADESMAARGWDRIVLFAKRGELVAVFVPQKIRSERNVKVCVAVLKGQKLVIASARTDLEPILKIALSQHHGRLPIRL